MAPHAVIAGIYEHPGRHLPEKSLPQLHAEVAFGALADAGLTMADVDGYFTGLDSPGLTGMGAISMAEYMGMRLRHYDSTDTGGSSYIAHVGHAAQAIAAGKCSVALITLAGKPRTGDVAPGAPRTTTADLAPEAGFEPVYGATLASQYALAAARHMYEYGTTSEQLAHVKTTASEHAVHNPNAFIKRLVSVDEVLDSPMVCSPLHRHDCCVITDGGGALVLVSPEIAPDLPDATVVVLGQAESPKYIRNGRVDLTYTGARFTGPRAFAEAGLSPRDIDYASIYDSFTITVIETIEDLGFCEKGKGGAFAQAGELRSPGGKLPFNTDGGGLCNNHPANRGGVTKVIEAVRQLRGTAHPEVQVPNCRFALAHGTGGSIGSRMGSATVIMGRDDA